VQIGHLLDKELGFRHFSLPRARGERNLSAAKISASAFRLKLKKAKRRATSIVSIRQALNCKFGSKINQANSPS
jgi:hypothetical protein